MLFEETRVFLKKLGFPSGDLYDLPDSVFKFSDGGDFKIEMATVNTSEALEALIDESKLLGITINRVTETYGLFRHRKEEVKQYVSIANSYGAELLMSVGPRASYDTSATAKTVAGKAISYRLRGQEQIIRAVEDVKRGVALGVRGFVVYDEGLLYLLNQMRVQGHLPQIYIKVSAHMGCSNPISLKVLEDLGANSINPVRDLQLPMIAAARNAVKIPLDIHTDNPISSGGFVRFYEVPEIIRIASPVYLKIGNSVVANHGSLMTECEARQMVRQAVSVLEIINDLYPKAIQSKSFSES